MYGIRDVRTCPDLHFYRNVYANTYTSAYTCVHMPEESHSPYVPATGNVNADQHRRYPVSACPMHGVPDTITDAHPRHAVTCPATDANRHRHRAPMSLTQRPINVSAGQEFIAINTRRSAPFPSSAAPITPPKCRR